LPADSILILVLTLVLDKSQVKTSVLD